MKSVWRQRKAGVWRTSTTFTTAGTSSTVCTSVRIGTPSVFFTLARISRPFSIPGPRNDLPELRFALSYEDLKTNGMPSAPVISFSWPATSIWSCSLSTTHGPAMRKKGWSRPASKPQSFTAYPAPRTSDLSSCFGTADHLQCRFRDAQLVLLQRGLDERGEERVAVARRRGELRVVLHAHEPRVVGELGDLGEVLGLGLGADDEARLLEARHVVVVDLVAVAMALRDRVLAVDLVRERALLHRGRLRAQAHGAAEVRLV